MPAIFYANASTSAPVTDEIVTFSAGQMPGGDGFNINSVVWDFGDGTTGTGAVATHTYALPGYYTWSAVVDTTTSGTINFDGNPIAVSLASSTYSLLDTFDGSETLATHTPNVGVPWVNGRNTSQPRNQVANWFVSGGATGQRVAASGIVYNYSVPPDEQYPKILTMKFTIDDPGRAPSTFDQQVSAELWDNYSNQAGLYISGGYDSSGNFQVFGNAYNSSYDGGSIPTYNGSAFVYGQEYTLTVIAETNTSVAFYADTVFLGRVAVPSGLSPFTLGTIGGAASYTGTAPVSTVNVTEISWAYGPPAVTYTASFTKSADVGYATFRPTFTSTSTPTPETCEWLVGGIVQATGTTWNAEFYDENPAQEVTLRCTWNSGSTVRTSTDTVNVLPTPQPRFSVSPIAGFAPFTVDITDISGPSWLGEYGANGWAYTMDTSGPSVFTQNGTFTYGEGLNGSFATSAKISYPLPLPLELQINVLTPNVTYVVGPQVEVLGENQRPDATITTTENTLFIPVKKVTNAQFASIQMRGVTNALPTTVLDNGGYPNRELFFWPIPNDGTKAIELWIWEPLHILDLDEELNLPPGYERYYIYALAMELCDTFGKRPTKEIIRSLMEAESAIKTLNQLDFRVAPSSGALEMNRNNRAYNIIDFRAGANMLPRTDQ